MTFPLVGSIKRLGAELWTPAQIIGDLVVWLKANETGTITYSAGTSISIADQSGNSNDFEKTSGTIPTSGVENIDGLNALGFNGGEDEYLRSVSSFSFRGAFLLGMGNTSISPTWASLPANMCFLGGAATVTAFIAKGTTDYLPQGASPAFSLHRNLGAISSSPSNTGNINYPIFFTYIEYVSNTTSQVIDIGEIFARAGRNFEGFFGELILINSTLSSANYEKIEGYAAWKWGMEGDLPIGHPYKSTPPTV